MSSVVALKQFPASADGLSFTVLPGDVFVSTDYSATGYAAILAAGAAQSDGNGLVGWDTPHPGLVAARAAVMELRAKAGLDPDGSNGSIMMLDGNALDSASDVSTGTATLVASTITVTVPPPAVGVAVPVGSKVYATVTTAAGKPKLLAAVRLSDTQITISSPGLGYGALLEAAGAAGTLVAGTVDILLANAVGDRLAVALVGAAIGTGGVLSVKRKSATEVTVESWVDPGGLQALDLSNVLAYNFGAAAQETSLVRWAVVRP